MPRIEGRATTQKTAQPTAKDVKAATVSKLKKSTSAALKNAKVTWGRTQPKGVKFIRVPLVKGRTDQYSYTALIPITAKLDPNKPKVFVIERSGGIAGLTSFSTPVNMSGKPARPLFDQLLTGQKPKPGGVTTAKFPSDSEDGGGGGGGIVTEKFPSDNEDGGVGGGGGVTTAKFPSDAEDGGGGGGGGIVTEKFPSDNEDGGGRPGGVTTAKFPSDNEDGGGRTGGGPMTEKFPSDNDE